MASAIACSSIPGSTTAETLRKVVATTVRHEDFIVRDHRVYGVRVLPGVTFLDLIYRSLAGSGVDTRHVRLANIQFKEPVVTSEEYDRVLNISIAPSGTAHGAQIISTPVQGSRILSAQEREVFRCDIHFTHDPPPTSLSLGDVISKAFRSHDVAQIYDGARTLGINHYEFMTSHGSVYEGRAFGLAEVYLSELARQYLEQFHIHPVYMDVATGMPLFLRGCMGIVADKPYIPLHIESFVSVCPLEDPTYIYMDKPTDDRLGDVITHSLDLYTKDSRLCARITGLTLKKVRSDELITSLIVKAQSLAVTAPRPAERPPLGRQVAVAAPAREAVTAEGKSAPAAVLFTRQLQELIAPLLECEPESIAVERSFYDLGLESSHLSTLVSELEAQVGCQLYPTLLFEYPNISELARYLTETYGDLPATKQSEPGDNDAAARNHDHSLRIYRPVWKEVSFSGDSRPSHGPVLVFDHDSDVSSGLAKIYQESGQKDVILVVPGKTFRATGECAFEIRPDEQGDYDRLFATLSEAGVRPQSVLHLCGLRPASGYASRTDEAQTAIRHGLMSLVCLIRTARRTQPQTRLRLTCFIDPSRPEHTALAGFFRTVTQEIPTFDCQLIGWNGPRSAALMLAAANAAHARDEAASRYLLYRDGKFQDREILPAETADDSAFANIKIRSGGTYLITGGLGGVGLIFADHFVRRYNANLILVGRTAPGETQRDMLRRLERAGCQLKYIQADVSDAERLRHAVASAVSQAGAIHGVIHSAGVIEDALLLNKNRASIERVLAPKVAGTIAVDEVTKNEPLDFFVVFSSLSGVFGNAGQSDYAFANSFLDDFVVERESLRGAGKRNGRSCSIAWPLWAAGGMRADRVHDSPAARGTSPLPSEEGLKAFEEVLRLGLTTALPVYGVQEQIAARAQVGGGNRTIPAAEAGSARAPISPVSNTERERATVAPIAIIGLSGRYAGAKTPEELWSALRAGQDLVTEIPRERWDYREYYDPQRGRPGKSYSKWGSFIEDVDKFDSLFFNIAPIEAERMDPQERLLLETAWAAIEDAGYAPENLTHSAEGESGQNVGVFVGVMWSDYQLFGHEECLKGNYVLANSWASMIPNRVSYALNFTGPSLPVDTACSSSLVAIHMACESIRRGDCPVAIAGGVNLSLHPSKYLKTSQLQMYSSGGRCRSFGEGGDGYVPGEGVGVVLLKPLDQAIADGDHISGVIRGSAVRHSGRTAGFAVPSPAAQAELIASNLKQSGTNARAVSYVEAHGTGTSLGDPIEIRGLTAAFRKDTSDRQFCSIGSVKSNLGHLEAAAGMAALTKVLMQLRHQEIAPTLHSEQPNTKIDFENSPFYLQQKATAWSRPRISVDGVERVAPRCAAISSFGAGGVNAHLVVEEFDPDDRDRSGIAGPSLIPLSARTPDALKTYCRNLKQHLERLIAEANQARTASEPPAPPVPDIRDIAWTLQAGRPAFHERIAVVASNCAETVEKLAAFLERRENPDVLIGSAKNASAIAAVLKDGAESRDFVRKLAGNRALEKLARLWVNGVPIDWPALHDGPRYRVPLPTYPFARERHWLTIAPAAEISRSAGEQTSAEQFKQEEEHRVSLSREFPIAAGSDELTFAEFTSARRLTATYFSAAQTTHVACEPANYESYLRDLLAEELKLRADQIDPTESVFNYGVDSIMLMKLRSTLEQNFGELPVMLFFEYKSVRELAGYFAATQPLDNAYTDDYAYHATPGAD